MYERFKPIPENCLGMASDELGALSDVWRERKQKLEGSSGYEEFVARLNREWAIETGIIERLYVWDRGVTETLIEQGIDAAVIAHSGGVAREDADRVADLIKDQHDIISNLSTFIQSGEPLTEAFIRGLQAQFTERQDSTEAETPDGRRIQVQLLKGQYKQHPNNPRQLDGMIHHYCPPEIVAEEMQGLVAQYNSASEDIAPEVLSAWLHHRFVYIHPFQDGNGRVARTLASVVFLKAGLFPLVVRDAERTAYIEALEEANAGELKPLVDFFTRRQRERLISALGIEQRVQESTLTEEIIRSTLGALRQRQDRTMAERQSVYDAAASLTKAAADEFTGIAESITQQSADNFNLSGENRVKAYSSSGTNDSEKRHYFYRQIIDMANSFDYFANFQDYRSWARLSIRGGGSAGSGVAFEYVISFHGIGHDTGVCAASAFTAERVPREDEEGTDTANLKPAMTDVFQFNYRESEERTLERFKEWLNLSSAIALGGWNRFVSNGS